MRKWQKEQWTFWMFFLSISMGCFDLDNFVHNPRHCSVVGPDTCDEDKNIWDRVCVPCDEPYDWEKEYPWYEGSLSENESIRPIPKDSVIQHQVNTEDGEGELDLYFIPAHGEHASHKDLTILYNHGNYAGIEHYLPRLRYLYEGGFNLVAWDYRGYGKSNPDSSPSGEAFVKDSQTVRDFVENRGSRGRRT